MPSYTIKRKSTEEEWNVVCTWEELQEILKEDSDLTQKLSAPRTVSSVGGVLSKTDDGWKDVLKKIKKGAGRGNTIRT